MSSAELTLRARVDDLAPDAVERALWTDRSLVKTWSMRGTPHLLPSTEHSLWQSGFGTYGHYRKPVRPRNFHLTEVELDQLMDAVAKALDGRTLSRSEIADDITALTGSAELGDEPRESWGAGGA